MHAFIKATHLARIAARSLIAAAIALFVINSNDARAVEYVKICSLYGPAFFYIPGSDTCTNANQIVTNQFGIARLSTLSATGTAMAASLVAPWLPTGTNYAISNHWATFDGQHAAGFSGLMRISGHLVFSAGFAAGLDNGNLLTMQNRTQTQFGTSYDKQSWSDVRGIGRAGFMYAW